MSIRPVDFNGMIQRTQDVSTLKQNEDNRPVVEQQTIFSQEMKKVEQNLHQVIGNGLAQQKPGHKATIYHKHHKRRHRNRRMPVIVMMPKKREMGIMKRKNGRKKTRSSKRLTMFI